MSAKSEFRQKYMEVRDFVVDKSLKSSKILRSFITSNEYKTSHTIMLYVSFKSEVETLDCIKKVLKDKKKLIIPMCDTSNKSIRLYNILSLEQLGEGHYGIMEPKPHLIKNGEISEIKDKNDIDLVVVPAIAFDRFGNRIGYGAGYYDRFLSGYNGVKIGFQYAECVLKKVPSAEYDIPVDMIITDLGCVFT